MNRKIKLLMKKAKKDTNDIHSLEILTAILFANFALVDESFHYSIPEYYRNIKIKKDDIDDMLTELVVIVNQKGENMRQAMECITQMKDDENKGYACAEKLFLQENWKQYPDFLVTLIFFLSIFDEEFQKYILRIIEYYNTIDNVFFHETIGSLLECKGYLQSISRE